jgi:hypothetical protein
MPLIAVAVAILLLVVLVYVWPQDAEPDIANPPSPESSSTAIQAEDEQVEPAPSE